MEAYEETIEERLRKDALRRMTDYIHPEITLSHQPIKARQCEELQAQLRELVRSKVDKVRREYESQGYNRQYQEVYSEFMMMTSENEVQSQKNCNDIRKMHQMADMLTHPPGFSGDLYLNSKSAASPIEQEQFKQLYKYYQKMHKSGQTLQQNEAQETIKMAKAYYLRDRS